MNKGRMGLLWLALAYAFPTLAAESPHQLYADTSYNRIDYWNDTEGAWTTTLGYSYFLSPFVGVDFGYSNTYSDSATFPDDNSESTKLKYRSFFAGARIEHPVSNYVSLFARGGIRQTTSLSDNGVSLDSAFSSEDSGINPYLGIGARMQPIPSQNLELSVELKYQDLQNEFSATSFMLGARFRL